MGWFACRGGVWGRGGGLLAVVEKCQTFIIFRFLLPIFHLTLYICDALCVRMRTEGERVWDKRLSHTRRREFHNNTK